MPNRVHWDSRFSVGNADLDAQHQHLFELCNAMADCLDSGKAAEERFDALFAELLEKARAHFAAEETLLAARAYPDLESLRGEQEEFFYLVEEIATPENFDRQELQTFLTLWWAGHVRSGSRDHPAWLSALG